MNILDFYQALLSENDDGNNARKVLIQTHWFSVNADFDPKSGEALPQSLTHFLKRITNPSPKEESGLIFHDRLWRIVSHCRLAIEHIMFSLNENPQREHALLPIRAVRELDASSFIKLSTRPGRNVREKLAGKPYLQAVRRYQSVNLPENRLFKVFLNRLLPLLKKRHEIFFEAFQEAPDALIPKMENWLRSDEAMSISRWENLPPNNTLLSHRDYRRIWDSWTWLQTLDADIKNDFDDILNRQKIVDFWNKIADLKLDADVKIAEIPVLFDYNHFRIWTLCDSKIFLRKNESATVIEDFSVPDTLSGETEHKNLFIHPIDKPVCVDFTRLRPVYAIENHMQKIPARLIWQRWHWNDQPYDISALQGDALFSNPQVTTITSSDLFFSENLDRGNADCAAFSIARDLHQIFLNDSMIWLFPDYLSDFDLEIIRRNINSTFQNATPLPRSIAAVFQNVDVSRIRGDNFAVLIIDILPEHVYATKLVAKYSSELEKAVPETKGFAWERHPSVTLKFTHFIEPIEYETVNDDGAWGIVKQKIPDKNSIDLTQLKKIPEIGDFTFYVILTDAPVVGGVRVSELQKKSAGVTLWYDHLPDLAMRTPVNGILSNFVLVKNRTILPIRKKVIPIEITNKFALSAGKIDYAFPLVQGTGESGTRYMAHLQSPFFPLKHDTIFTLQMTYEYGADIPYQLVFVSDEEINGKKIKIIVQWRPYSAAEELINAYNSPEFPVPSSFDEVINQAPKITFRCFEQSWWENFEKQYDTLIDFQRDPDINIEEIHFKLYKEGNSFAFGVLDDGRDVYCHKKAFLSEDDFNSWRNGTTMYACLEEREKGLAATLVSSQPKDEIIKEKIRELQKQVARSKRSLHFALYSVLGTLQNWDCVDKGSTTILKNIRQTMQYITARNTSSPLPGQIKKEMFLLLSFTHKYAPRELGDYLLEALESPQWKEYITEIGYAIGDCSQPWQKRIWDVVLSHWTAKGLIEASSIRIMNIALLRNPHLMDEFSFSQADSYIQKIVSRLEHDLKEIDLTALQRYSNIPIIAENHNTRENFVLWKESLKLTALLELSLLMLLLRKSDDSSIKNLLYPTNPRTIKFLKLLDTLDPINFNKFSRIKISVKKPESASSISDLLFALKYYLSGSTDDVGIRVLEVKNESDEQ